MHSDSTCSRGWKKGTFSSLAVAGVPAEIIDAGKRGEANTRYMCKNGSQISRSCVEWASIGSGRVSLQRKDLLGPDFAYLYHGDIEFKYLSHLSS